MQTLGRTFGWAIALAGITMLAGEARAAGGAFVVDDAAVDEPGACKVESSASFAGNRDFLGLVTPACVVPLFRPVELGVNIVRDATGRRMGHQPPPKAKMNILPAETGKLGLAIVERIGVRRTDRRIHRQLRQRSGDLYVQRNVQGQFQRRLDLRAAHESAFLSPTALGVEWIPMKPFTLIAEVFGVGRAAGGFAQRHASRASRPGCASRRSTRSISTSSTAATFSARTRTGSRSG